MSSNLDDMWGLDSGAWAVRVEVSTADGMEEESLHLFGRRSGGGIILWRRETCLKENAIVSFRVVHEYGNCCEFQGVHLGRHIVDS